MKESKKSNPKLVHFSRLNAGFTRLQPALPLAARPLNLSARTVSYPPPSGGRQI